MYQYHRIEDLKRHPNLNDMVFGSIWCGESKPYEHHIEVPKHKRGVQIPLVLMHMRWDGFIGFPGGKVETGEELHEALIREMEEEYNFTVRLKHLVNDKPIHLCSHADNHGELHTHCFELEVSKSEFKRVIELATEAEHFGSEVQGVFAVQIAEFEKGIGYSQFRKNNFKASAGLQIDALVRRHGWLPLK